MSETLIQEGKQNIYPGLLDVPAKQTKCLMIQKSLQLFTEKEEDFLNLFIEIGIRKNVARILVYLASTPEATLRDIEHGTDLIRDIKNYVKRTTAPYKYPREIEFVADLPKTISGTIKRNELRAAELKKYTGIR
jgi:acyl-CoA synthetase (AMP-forming)/AMP-acid ligase II